MADVKPTEQYVETKAAHNGSDVERSDSDGEDHYHEPPMTFHRFMAFVGLAFLWTGSQIPVYLFGGVPPYIYSTIGGADRWIWFVLANLLSLAAVCPFVGSLSDLIGRRNVALLGALLLMIGMAVCGTAQHMNPFIGGMAIAGAGAGICELTALAATSELAPTRKRGKYVAVLIFTIIPFCPSVLWAQLIAYHSTWRNIAWLCLAWNGAGFLAVGAFYFPPPRPNSKGLTKMEILKRIDYVGGLLSVSGLIVFLAGIEWGGYQYKWTSAHVLAPLIIGGCLLIAFGFWEIYGAKYPIFPSELKVAPRILTLTLVITAISGANFFSVIMFWPTQAFNVYGHDPVGVGIRGIPVGFSILAGAVIVLWLLSVFSGRNRELMIASSVIMTAGCASLAVANPHNIKTVYGLLVLAGLGIGGIVVPASIISTIICPDELIATVAALTLAIRVVGGAVGYTVYYNVFIQKFVPNATKYIGYTMYSMNITTPAYIEEAIILTGASLLEGIKAIPGVDSEAKYQAIVTAGQLAFSESYRYVYLTSIAFGAISIVASIFLGDIKKYMTDHVAVIIH